MKEIALVCGVLSGLSGVVSAIAFLKGSKALPWDLQTWNGQSAAEIAFRAAAQRWNKIGQISLFIAFALSAASSIASYYG